MDKPPGLDKVDGVDATRDLVREGALFSRIGGCWKGGGDGSGDAETTMQACWAGPVLTRRPDEIFGRDLWDVAGGK